MSDRDNVRLIEEAYAAFGRGDVQAVLDALTPDVEWTIPGPREVKICGVRRGHAQVGEFFRDLAEAEEIEQFEPRDFIASGDKVVAIGHYRSKIRATGATADMDWVHVFTFRSGKVASFREFTDSLAVAEAYGVRPATAAAR